MRLLSVSGMQLVVNLTIVDYSLQAIFLYGYIGAAAHLPVKLFIRNGLLPEEDCLLQLDERNEKSETKTRGNFDCGCIF